LDERTAAASRNVTVAVVEEEAWLRDRSWRLL
jgi:hypothetical protein